MKQITFIIVLIFIASCANENSHENVGDISFDALLDDENFEICNEQLIKQYYVRNSSDTPPGYKGEKKALEQTILNNYKYPKSKDENGYITIRFIVNCKGNTGRFRMEEMDFDYKPDKFDAEITEQLLKIVKKMDAWIPRKKNQMSYDFYQYLTFKIKNGQIVKILP